MEKIKKYWREIAIVFLAILFISNCTGKGNYKRKYNKQIQRTEFVHDSLKSIYSSSINIIDSLNHEVKSRDEKIVALESQIEIYKDQNNKLANKPVVVRVNNNKK